MVVASAMISAAAMPFQAQSPGASGETSDAVATTRIGDADLSYQRPSQKAALKNYMFDAFGPYPIFGAAFGAGVSQLGNSPPEWGEGAKGFGKQMGSDFAIGATGTTVRYGLAEALRQDTLYYRCDCRGFIPRMRHAILSTLIARRREDGHQEFSVPALLAPYAGSFTAVYGWYPDRFGAKDAFRIGNYGMLAHVGENIGFEFVYSGPHSLLSRMHLTSSHVAQAEGASH